MVVTWDEAKRRANLKKHGLDFADVERFDWETALVQEDRAMDYGETRWMAIGWIDQLVVLFFVDISDENIRIISLRKATKAEKRRYVKETQGL